MEVKKGKRRNDLLKSELQLSIIKCLSANEMLNSNQVAKALNKEQSGIYKQLHKMLKDNYVNISKDKKFYLNKENVNKKILAHISSLNKEVEYYRKFLTL